MKNLVFQYYLPFNGVGKDRLCNVYTNQMPKWAKVSQKMFKTYADHHGADYILGQEAIVGSISPYFEVTRIYNDPLFDQYDKILYVDVDVIPKNINQSIFDVPVVDIAGWPEYKNPIFKESPKWKAEPALVQRYKDFGSFVVPPKTVAGDIRMVNTGVMLWSKQARLKARECFDDHDKWFQHKNALLDPSLKGVGHSSHCLDQPYLNAMWTKYDMDILELDLKWNHFPSNNGEHNANFIHYVGKNRYDIPRIYGDPD